MIIIFLRLCVRGVNWMISTYREVVSRECDPSAAPGGLDYLEDRFHGNYRGIVRITSAIPSDV